MNLYIVATPIGNLADLSARAIEILKEVDVILCEDTRVAQKLLSSFDIETKALSYHQHSKTKKYEEIFRLLEEGKRLALVSDAGTPGISDPGGILIEALVKRFGDEIRIIPIPGPNAAIAALSICGFPTDEFWFGGFPPHKKGRQKYFDRIAERKETQVFYESKHRIEKALAEIEMRMPERVMVLCRELTKLHESIYRGTAGEVTNRLKSDSVKGEFVVVIGPRGR